MFKDPSDLLLSEVRPFTIGFVLANGRAPSVLGSGVLTKIGAAYGIFTCAHVVDEFERLPEIGLLRLSRDGLDQRQVLKLEGTFTIKLGGPSYDSPQDHDVAFVQLGNPVDITALKATSVFLNFDRNMNKFETDDPSKMHIDAVFGMVSEFSSPPIFHNGVVTTAMKGVLSPGRIINYEESTMTFEGTDSSSTLFPKKFGGTSGGGLWRFCVEETDADSYKVVDKLFCGVASFQRDDTHLVCQSTKLIELALVPEITMRWP
jgi:hypothetical protein